MATGSAEAVNLGLLNIKMAADRTLMAWTSISLSLLSFGFVIAKILAGYNVKSVVFPGANTPRNVGMFLVVSGTLAIMMGMGSYVRTLRRLRPLQQFGFMQPPLILALLMFCLGLFLCIGTVLRQH
jgi:putative membrane protein